MLRMKTMHKKAGNKRGVILVTILFIFAIAMIFIASALMMSSNTRTRIYERAEKNQARLTVTAAAEAFYSALYTQEITDAQLKAMADNGKYVLKMNDGKTPGLQGAADNGTTVTIKNGPGTDHITLTFVTKIDEQEEHVQMVLKYMPDASGSNKRSGALIDTNGDADLGQVSVGEGGEGKEDNFVLVRGNLSFSKGNSTATSRYIVKGDVQFRDDFFGNTTVVLWGSDNKLDLTAGNNISLQNLYFVNPTNSVSNSTTINFTNRNFSVGNEIYVNRSSYTEHFTNGNKPSSSIIGVSGDGKSALSGYANMGLTGMNADVIGVYTSSVSSFGTDGSAARTAVSDALGYIAMNEGEKFKDYISTDYPTIDDAMTPDAKGKKEFAGSKTVPSGAVNFSFSHPSGAIDPKTYVINSSQTGGDNPANRRVWECNSGEYWFYIDGNIEWQMGVFYVKPAAKVHFVLTEGSSLTMGNYSTGAAGIMSTPARTLEEAKASQTNCTGTSYPSDKCTKLPNAYIYGVGNNKLTMKKYTVMDAFIKFYDTSEWTNKARSEIYLNDAPVWFYGTLGGAKIKMDGSEKHIYYCPLSASAEDDNTVYPKFSDYYVESFLYYY